MKISAITKQLIEVDKLPQFEALLADHEAIISALLNQPTIKNRLFSDYNGGVIKSLGAWGGDFVLVTGTKEKMSYFIEKGFETIVPFSEMVL